MVNAVSRRVFCRLVRCSFPGTQQVADPIQRIISAAAVAVDVLLDPAADLIDRGCVELDHVEGVEHRDAARPTGR